MGDLEPAWKFHLHWLDFEGYQFVLFAHVNGEQGSSIEKGIDWGLELWLWHVWVYSIVVREKEIIK